jgi:uncharacterized OB-fold protein
MPYLKPLPQVTTQNRPFWVGLREHEFLVPRCRDCGDYNWVPYPACRSCWSEDLAWTAVSGQATVWSHSVVHRGMGAFVQETPYIVVLGKLREEPRSLIVAANLVGVEPGQVHIGMPIEITYQDIPEEDITMYQFRAAKEPT